MSKLAKRKAYGSLVMRDHGMSSIKPQMISKIAESTRPSGQQGASKRQKG